ncbi:pentapeptide repeat-containing protein [Dactylosporangium sp. NPDC005555]|uniref:pentapeptide repeat-containing protein n=1 Tax=Dactylosporangium sp. NPDC005555 TaxID=3154889 RepID=UPI0033A0373A
MSGGDATEPLERANDRIRDASKWLVASAAAVGAALIAGSQLSDIGHLPVGAPTTVEHARLWVAVVGAMVGLLAVVHVIWRAVQILLPAMVTLETLHAVWDAPPRDLRRVVTFFRDQPRYLQGFDTPGELIRYRTERANALAGTPDLPGLTGDERERLVTDIQDELGGLDQRVTTIEVMAAHELLKSQFHGALPRLLVSAGLAALGVTAFAWAANPADRPATADLRNVRLVNAFLRDSDLRDAKLDHADLTGADLTGADLTGASIVGTIWRDTTCPDGRNSDDVGGTCAGHLS